MDQPDPQTPQRLHALDAVRGLALFLGIVLHVSLAFLPGGFFVIENDSHSTVLAVIFFAIHTFRMTAFFLIAGFFGRLLLQRSGTAQFIRNRLTRIVVPLIAGWMVCTVLILRIFAWAIEQRYGVDASARSLGWPAVWLTHLWFLYYLLWMYAITLAVRSVWVQIDRHGKWRGWIDRLVRFIVTRKLAVLAAALPVAGALYSIESWYAWGGIPTPDRWLLPLWPTLISYAVAFGFGWLLHRQIDLLRVWQQHWRVNLIAASVFVLLSYAMTFGFEDNFAPDHGWYKAVYALCYALAAWSATLALLGIGMRFLGSESPLRRYLADASYWLYVAHLPLVFALQTALMQVDLHWSLKFTFILLVTCAVLLPIYHYWVRPTFIGAILNGRRHPRIKLTTLWQRPPAEASLTTDRLL
jgi:glucans biosynthesis protein C